MFYAGGHGGWGTARDDESQRSMMGVGGGVDLKTVLEDLAAERGEKERA